MRLWISTDRNECKRYQQSWMAIHQIVNTNDFSIGSNIFKGMVPICEFIRHCDDRLPFAQNKTSTRFHGGWIHIQNRGSLLLLLYSARQWQRSSAATIINIFITIQYCGFMQTIGSSGGSSRKREKCVVVLCTLCCWALREKRKNVNAASSICTYINMNFRLWKSNCILVGPLRSIFNFAFSDR